MTLKEASSQFGISLDRLKSYEENGLLIYKRLVDGIPDYTEEELGKAGLIHFLLESGMEMDVLQKFMCLLREKSESRECIELRFDARGLFVLLVIFCKSRLFYARYLYSIFGLLI